MDKKEVIKNKLKTSIDKEYSDLLNEQGELIKKIETFLKSKRSRPWPIDRPRGPNRDKKSSRLRPNFHKGSEIKSLKRS